MAMSRRKEVGSAQAKPPPSLVPTRYSALVGREGGLSTNAYLILSGAPSLPASSEEDGELSANAYLTLSGDFSLPACSEEGWGAFCECLLYPLPIPAPPPLCELATASVWGRGGRRVPSLPPRGQREGVGVSSQEGARRAPRGTLYRKVTKVVSLQSPVYLAVQ